MIRRLVCFALVAAVTAGDLAAQSGAVSPQCGTGSPSALATQDACQKALDLFQFMAPQLGIAIVGGNAVSGEHSALRGLGHVSIGMRGNVLQSRLPQVADFTPAVTGAVRTDYSIKTQTAGVPTVDAAIGLFRGLEAAGTTVLGLDALVNVAYIPEISTSGVDVSVPGGSLKFGFGARLGIFRETLVTPGIAVTWLKRDLPTVDVVGKVGQDDLAVRNIDVQTTAWRVVAGKHFSVLALSVGAGQDKYETGAQVSATVNRLGQTFQSATIDAAQTLTRDNIFGNVALDLGSFRLVGELGRVSGGSLDTLTASGGRRPTTLTYASFGLRVGW